MSREVINIDLFACLKNNRNHDRLFSSGQNELNFIGSALRIQIDLSKNTRICNRFKLKVQH